MAQWEEKQASDDAIDDISTNDSMELVGVETNESLTVFWSRSYLGRAIVVTMTSLTWKHSHFRVTYLIAGWTFSEAKSKLRKME